MIPHFSAPEGHTVSPQCLCKLCLRRVGYALQPLPVKCSTSAPSDPSGASEAGWAVPGRCCSADANLSFLSCNFTIRMLLRWCGVINILQYCCLETRNKIDF